MFADRKEDCSMSHTLYWGVPQKKKGREEKRMKKVAIVTSLSGVGGTERSLLNLLKELPEGCLEITLLLIGKDGPFISEIPNWISIKHIHSKSGKGYIQEKIKKGKFLDAFQGMLRLIKLRQIWKKYRTDTMLQYQAAMYLYEAFQDIYDIAICWYVPNSYQTVYTIEKVRASKKILWIHMDVQMDKMPFDAEHILKQYNRFYCVSKACLNSFVSQYPACAGRAGVFYNIIKPEQVKAAALENIVCFEENIFHIVTCGRIAPEKQPWFAIDVMKQLKRDGINCVKWYFVGDGPLLQDMQTKILAEGLDDSIIMLGVKVNPYPYLKQADLYVQMSEHESYCLTLAEAQILGVPAISTNFKSAYEIVEDRVTGLIVENTWQAICESTRELIINGPKYRQLKENTEKSQLCSIGNTQLFFEI